MKIVWKTAKNTVSPTPKKMVSPMMRILNEDAHLFETLGKQKVVEVQNRFVKALNDYFASDLEKDTAPAKVNKVYNGQYFYTHYHK